jgi:hypothetical protein
MDSAVYKYNIHFEFDDKNLLKFMKVFNIKAYINLKCVLHEKVCGSHCKFTDRNTIILNGYYWHCVDHWCSEYNDKDITEITLSLPYAYDFKDVDEATMYSIIKYNHKHNTFVSPHLDIIDADVDWECIDFQLNYCDEWVPFETLLKKYDLGDIDYELKSTDSSGYFIDHTLTAFYKDEDDNIEECK